MKQWKNTVFSYNICLNTAKLKLVIDNSEYQTLQSLIVNSYMDPLHNLIWI